MGRSRIKGFEAQRNERGDPQVVCSCEECGAQETVRATLGMGSRTHGPTLTNKSMAQAARKLTAHGWSYIGKTLLCPECEAKRKEKTMVEKKTVDVTPLPERPTRGQRREIMEKLEDTYDVSAGRYMSGYSDFVVAEELKVRPGWVTEVRDAFFGPEGTNDDVEVFGEMLDELHRKLNGKVAEAERLTGELRQDRAEVAKLKVELERIKKALGPHVLARAGV